MEWLIRAQGGKPFIAPSMREIPLEDNTEALAFAERLFRGDFNMMIFLTGVGARLLNQVIEARFGPGTFLEALRKLTVVARGSKPIAALQEWKVPVTVAVPEPNTWREVLESLKRRREKRIAVQEFGRPSTELIEGLRQRGAEVTPVSVYQWALPEDLAPLHEAVRRLAMSEVDVVLFATSMQAVHLMQIAAQEGAQDAVREGLARAVVASVGPTTSGTLADYSIRVDLEPSHPKMGFLINETAAKAAQILAARSALSRSGSPEAP